SACSNHCLPFCASLWPGLEIATLSLIALDGFKERFDIAGAKATRVLALNDFRKDRRAGHDRLGEDLQQVTPLVSIDEYVQLAQLLRIFFEVADSLVQDAVVSIRCSQKLDAIRTQSTDAGNNVVRRKCDVLCAGTVVKSQVLFDLRLTPARRGFDH